MKLAQTVQTWKEKYFSDYKKMKLVYTKTFIYIALTHGKNRSLKTDNLIVENVLE